MMEKKLPEGLDLVAAQKIIAAQIRPTEGESVALEDALLRLPVKSLRAVKPQPGYDQSTRDGFVISGENDVSEGGGCSFRIEGEIRAGTTDKRSLRPGAACRIMTGGLIPARGLRVIPQEDCRERDGKLSVPDAVLHRRETFIRRRGSELVRGKVVVSAGTPILPDHLVLLAATGHSQVTVHRQPRVAFFCTGSELVATPQEEEDGLKVSSNRYLLHGLIRLSGGIPRYLGTVADTHGNLAMALGRIDRDATDVIITTGGMGPGRYDLLEEAFVGAGGEIIYRSLHVRPGKATLFGMLGNSLFFGLPGPPPAVGVLFNELVAPALFLLQGMKKSRLRGIRASLQEAVLLKEKGVPNLKGGVLTGRNSVRLAGKTEVAGCYILFPGHRRSFKKEEMVEVHLINPPFGHCQWSDLPSHLFWHEGQK
jgi:molybdopterin molybdotransferase